MDFLHAANFDLIQLTEPDPHLETTQGTDEPTSSASETDRSHTAAIMDTDKSS